MERKRSKRFAGVEDIEVDHHGMTKDTKLKTPRDGSRRGGYRAGAGRPKGAKNKPDAVFNAYMNKVVNRFAEELPKGEVLTTLGILQAIYRDPRVPWPVRFEAVKRAVPYEYPRVKSVEPEVPPNLDPEDDHERTANSIRERLERKLLQAASGQTGQTSKLTH
jgi:hypothetical protein